MLSSPCTQSCTLHMWQLQPCFATAAHRAATVLLALCAAWCWIGALHTCTRAEGLHVMCPQPHCGSGPTPLIERSGRQPHTSPFALGSCCAEVGCRLQVLEGLWGPQPSCV